MSAKFPSSEERKRLLQSFYDLPPKDKEMLYKAVEHLRWLTILWGLEEIDLDSMPSILEKQHILLAYKLLEMLWFDELPEAKDQPFTVYVRDRLPDGQDPAVVNDIFDTNADELAARCEGLSTPELANEGSESDKNFTRIFPIQGFRIAVEA